MVWERRKSQTLNQRCYRNKWTSVIFILRKCRGSENAQKKRKKNRDWEGVIERLWRGWCLRPTSGFAYLLMSLKHNTYASTVACPTASSPHSPVVRQAPAHGCEHQTDFFFPLLTNHSNHHLFHTNTFHSLTAMTLNLYFPLHHSSIESVIKSNTCEMLAAEKYIYCSVQLMHI